MKCDLNIKFDFEKKVNNEDDKISVRASTDLTLTLLPRTLLKRGMLALVVDNI